MKPRRVLTIVKMEMTRQIMDPMILIFTMLLVPALILLFGLILTIFDMMLPGFLAYAGLLTIYDVAAGVASERESGIQKRMAATPLTTAEYVMSQMISYSRRIRYESNDLLFD
ncbi:MAG: hypothetical protein ACTSR1_14555 [Candidatus Heimdallarchaeota archaeon]